MRPASSVRKTHQIFRLRDPILMRSRSEVLFSLRDSDQKQRNTMTTYSPHTRWKDRGQRPAHIANCSGAKMDPGYQMLRQAQQGDVDFITGDYLAEFNLAENAEAFARGEHPGYEPTAWDGIEQSLDTIAKKKIKLIINGGSINPSGLAKKTVSLAKEKRLNLSVAYVEGDNVLHEMQNLLEFTGALPRHLDPEDSGIRLAGNAHAYLDKEKRPLVAANAYLGARGIVKGLEAGADIIICGRVADASPVIAAAWWWHSWNERDYDCLAGALVAGHLIECSGYVTGSNFSGFTDFPLDMFVDIAYGIAEIGRDGSCVITKHKNTNGVVNEDTVLTQFLYELQGDIYLNSDVKAYVSDIKVQQIDPDRVRVTGIRGAPPPPTTKVAIFYKGGFQSEILINATGYDTNKKFALQEKQIRYGLEKAGLTQHIDILDFQHVGRPAINPQSQLASTSYLRIFAQATSAPPLLGLLRIFGENAMQHFSGMHGSLDHRAAIPKSFLALYPAVYSQNKLRENVTIFGTDENGDQQAQTIDAGHPPAYEPVEARQSYDTYHPIDLNPGTLSTVGTAERTVRLGDVCQARSGDKGANVNFGIFPRRVLHNQALAWEWLCTWLSRDRMKQLLGEDWREEYLIERVEFPKIRAVHFVIYGWLGRGVSSSTILDPFGKGFADYIRDKEVQVPEKVLEGANLKQKKSAAEKL